MWVQSLVRELRSHMPHGIAKKQNKTKKQEHKEKRTGYDDRRWSVRDQKGALCQPEKLGLILAEGGAINGSHGRKTSLVGQWLRIHLAMQGTQVQYLVRELRSHMLQGN